MAWAEGDVCRVSAKMSLLNSIDVVNVWHAKLLSETTPTNAEVLEDMAERLDDQYAILAPSLTTSLAFTEIQAYGLNPTVPLGVTSWPTLTTGDNDTADMLVTGAAALIKFSTEALRGQGKKYIGGLTEGQIAGGIISGATLLSALVTFAAMSSSAFVSANGNTWRWGIYREATGSFWRYVEAIVSTVPAYQRRRKLGVGD